MCAHPIPIITTNARRGDQRAEKTETLEMTIEHEKRKE